MVRMEIASREALAKRIAGFDRLSLRLFRCLSLSKAAVMARMESRSTPAQDKKSRAELRGLD